MSKPVPSSSEEYKTVSLATSARRKRPERGPGSSMSANFRSAMTSILVYRLRSLLTISGTILGALVAMGAVTLVQGMRTLPEVPPFMQTMTGSALVSLVVGALASMNSMLVSVVERAREISMRRVVGARGRDIRSQILLEALILSSIGAVLGTLSGLLIGLLLTSLLQLPFVVVPLLVLLLLSMSITMGVLCGIYPALQASRLDPGETLRIG